MQCNLDGKKKCFNKLIAIHTTVKSTQYGEIADGRNILDNYNIINKQQSQYASLGFIITPNNSMKPF